MNLKNLLNIAALTSALCVTASSAEPTYSEPYRPQFHFTPAKNWMNDPNGLIFYEGEYHLFYQYNPFGDKWGHMSWGHAVSADMVHWKHLPLALAEENDIMIFSGSAVVDWQNTSGFGKDGKPPLVAIYTGHYTKKPLQNQHIAYSNDRGRTWTKYEGNPVLDINEKDFRDPKVIWHEPTKRWVMTISWCHERKVRFYSSPDLKQWSHLSDFGPAGSTTSIWECPDMFPLSAKRGDNRYVLIVNVGGGGPAGGFGCQYFVGTFDGRTFTLDPSHPKPQPEFVPEGKVIGDFENGYGEWQIVGDAFGEAPARGTLANQQAVDGFRGQSLVNTYHRGDQTRGKLTSPEFEIDRDHLSFLIGGGRHPGRTGIALLIDGRTVRIATGDDTERLSWKSWNVSEFRGRRARVEIFDQEAGGWGHINVDHILLADKPARPATTPVLWVDSGPDFYAAVTWGDIPKRDGRRILLGWASNSQYASDLPTSPWRSSMSLPRELTLRETPEGIRLFQQPIRELENLRGKKLQKKDATVAELNSWLRENNVSGPLWEIEIEVDSDEFTKTSTELNLELLASANQQTVLRYDSNRKLVLIDRSRSGNTQFNGAFGGVHAAAPVKTTDDDLLFHLFVDTSSVELFSNNGESVISTLVFPNTPTEPFKFNSSNPKLEIDRFTAWKLKPAIPTQAD